MTEKKISEIEKKGLEWVSQLEALPPPKSTCISSSSMYLSVSKDATSELRKQVDDHCAACDRCFKQRALIKKLNALAI